MTHDSTAVSRARPEDRVASARDRRVVQVRRPKDDRGEQQAPQLAPLVRDTLDQKVLQDAPEEELLRYGNRHVDSRKRGQELKRKPQSARDRDSVARARS